MKVRRQKDLMCCRGAVKAIACGGIDKRPSVDEIVTGSQCVPGSHPLRGGGVCDIMCSEPGTRVGIIMPARFSIGVVGGARINVSHLGLTVMIKRATIG